MANIEISVVIPSYNRRDSLGEMLKSLSSQTYACGQFEAIVVVDGSSDGTWEMLHEMRVPYALRPVYQEQSGPSAARNHGAHLAQGNVLLFLDDDLLPETQLIEEHAMMHKETPHAVVLGRFLPVQGQNGAMKGGWNASEDRLLKKHYGAMLQGKRPPAGRRLYSGNFSVPREDFMAVGGFDQSLTRGEDVELGFRLEEAGLHFHFNPRAAAVHRGYRDFASWCKSAYLYGRGDVLLARHKQRSHIFFYIYTGYHTRPVPLRWLVKLGMGRERIHWSLVRTVRFGADALFKVGLGWSAHYGYSAIFWLRYWQGVVDEIGGPAVFRQYGRQFGRHQATRSRQGRAA